MSTHASHKNARIESLSDLEKKRLFEGYFMRDIDLEKEAELLEIRPKTLIKHCLKWGMQSISGKNVK